MNQQTAQTQPKKSDLTRAHILETGERLIASKGFTGLGLGELLKTAKVPKGSFYHYFTSKEDFGEKLLDHYLEDYMSRLDGLESVSDYDGRQRLLAYWQRWIDTQCGITLSEDGCERKCLIVKLSAEIADISDPMRLVLASGTSRVIAQLASWIEEGQKDGSLASGIQSLDVATMLYHMWLGASLRAKLEKSDAPFLMAKSATMTLLPAP